MTATTDSADSAAIDAALAGFTEMMRTDGYLLAWEPSAPDRIVVTISATEGACADCLVPQPVMEAIMSSALAETAVSVDRVILPAAH
ncbi:hypothetical protein [Microbacterium sp.]|uniref:hypothetical protein n=1 Tax=Microbacterium sp. TaxID=51671 RepID=UPI003A944D25